MNERFIAAVCPHCGIKQVFDKSEICVEDGVTTLVFRKQRRSTLCRCLVTCRGRNKDGAECRYQFEIEVDCEGYI